MILIFVTWQLRVTLDSIHNSCDVLMFFLQFFTYITEIKNWLPYRGLTDSSGAQELGSSQPGDIQPTHPMGSSETNASVARPAQVLKPGSIPHHLPTYFSFPPIQVWWIWKRKTKLLKLYSNKICSKENMRKKCAHNVPPTEEEVLRYCQDSKLQSLLPPHSYFCELNSWNKYVTITTKSDTGQHSQFL